jgi:hypothetical protein
MEQEKNCESCKYKKVTPQHRFIIILSTSFLFLSFYGGYKLIKDLISLFY